MRLSRDQWGLQLALLTGQRGTCCRRQVGCVLLDSKGHVLATGYNGVAAGLPHCSELVVIPTCATGLCALPEIRHYPYACPGAGASSGTSLDACQAIHAEQNALLQCRDVGLIGTCYTSCSPCITCVKLLLNTGCRRLVFKELYPHGEALDLWASAGRETLQL